MFIKPIDLEAKVKTARAIAEIPIHEYCLHGKRINDTNNRSLDLCVCCGNFVEMSFKLIQVIFCKWCLTNEVKKELI